MTYVAWAAFYEGETDAAYFNVLLPRVMDDVVLRFGTRNVTIPLIPSIHLMRGDVARVAREACEARDAFHVVFFHADTGGRALEQQIGARSTRYCKAMHEICKWPLRRCIVIAPRHETEAWLLADPPVVCAALGYTGQPESIELPTTASAAERLPDPKATLATVARIVRGRRRAFDLRQIFPAVAQRQDLASLRASASFAAFERNVLSALADLGCVHPPD